MQSVDADDLESWSVDEPEPLDTCFLEAEAEASLWVRKNILKTSKSYGVNFQGCEEEALSLFMKIDGRRQVKRD